MPEWDRQSPRRPRRPQSAGVCDEFRPRIASCGSFLGDGLEAALQRLPTSRGVPYNLSRQLGNIAYWVKRPLRWDPVQEQFAGDPAANRFLDRPRRDPWTL